MLTPDSIVGAAVEQVSSDLAGEVIILNLNSATYYGLDAVGASVWKLVQKPRTVRDICDAIVEEYEVDAERCESDVLPFLEALTEAGLVETRDVLPA